MMALRYVRPLLPTLSLILIAIALYVSDPPQRLSAQDDSDTLEHTLLWRIDGNGLEHSSYLYGTFHTQDPRAFNFRDSVIPALLSCTNAAFELQMDTLVTASLRRIYYPDSVINLRDFLSPEQFDILDERLQAQVGISAEQLQYADPSLLLLFVEDMALEPEGPPTFDMEMFEGGFRIPKETALDAWLFRTARLEGLNAVGLETLDEQISITDTIPLRERINMLVETIEYDPNIAIANTRALVKAYEREDLNALLGFVTADSMPTGVLFRLLTLRNRNMADRMIPLMRNGATFTAVGAAHLPGEEGLIDLLRRKGFTVTPVVSDRTGVAAEYRRPERTLPWYEYNDEQSGFSVETPIPMLDIPVAVYDVGNENDLHQWIATDLTTGLTFMTMVNKVHITGILNGDVLGQMKEIWFGDGEESSNGGLGMLGATARVMREREIEVDGVSGLEITGIDTDGDLTRMRLFLHRGHLYVFSVSGGTSVLKTKDDTRFLRSVGFKKAGAPEAWVEMKIPETDVSATFPGPVMFDTIGQWEYGLNGYATTITTTGIEPETGSFFVVGRTRLPFDFINRNDSLLVSSMTAGEINGDVLRSDTTIPLAAGTFPGKGWEYLATLTDSGVLHRWVTLDGEWLLTFSTIRPKGLVDPVRNKRFFDGIRFAETREQPTEQRFPTYNFAVSVTAPFVDSGDFGIYPFFGDGIVVSSRSGGNQFLVTSGFFNPYYQAVSMDSLLTARMNNLTDWRDTVGDHHTVNAAGLQWREYDVTVGTAPTGGLHYRERITVHGTRFYRLRAVMSDNESEEEATAFFDSFRLLNPDPEGSILVSKSDQVLRDLTSTDSVVLSAVKSTLWNIEFEEKDRDRIFESLTMEYPSDQETENDIKRSLISKFSSFDDDRTVDFLEEYYRDLPEDHQLRSAVLSTLYSIRTKESIGTANKLLLGSPRDELYGYSILGAFYSSLEGFEYLFPDILDLAGDRWWGSTIIDLTLKALDSNAVTLDLFGDRRDEFYSHLTERVESYAKKSTEVPSDIEIPIRLDEVAETEGEEPIYQWEAVRAIEFLGRFPADRSVDKMLEQLLWNDEIEVRSAAIVALLRHDRAVRSKWIESVAEDRKARAPFLRALQRAGLSEKFPAEFRSQISIAESMALEEVTYMEEYMPEKFEYVADREIVRNDGSVARAYLFRWRFTTYEEDESGETDTTQPWHIALCFQPADRESVDVDPGVVRYTYTTFDPENLDAHFTELVDMEWESPW